MNLDLECRDTIAAVATAQGEGAVAIVRVSGPEAEVIRDRVFRPRRQGRFRPASLRLGDVITQPATPTLQVSVDPVDEALCAWFTADRSYTGETAFELQIHGGSLNTGRVLTAVRGAGARLAEAGEFTMRAFLHDRLDLTQAEAVQQIVGAQTAAALSLAQRALRGEAGDTLTPLVERLTSLIADLEAGLDFPEEELPPEEPHRLAERVGRLRDEVARLQSTATTSARLLERPRVVLAGPPNAGKSTLLNALCGRERALTHPEAGTTRDLLEVAAVADGTEVTLVDTAGLRAAATGIEDAAVQRARHAIEAADVRVLVLDASRPLDDDDRAAREELEGAIVVANKVDLGHDVTALGHLGDQAIAVSAHRGTGLDLLRAAVERRARPLGDALGSGWLVTLERHAVALDDAATTVAEAAAAVRAGIAAEVIAVELRRALDALASITGVDPTEAVLHSIFSRFCIGK